jgi:hypothetical protein
MKIEVIMNVKDLKEKIVLCEVLDSYPIYKIINLVEASSLSEKN